MFLYICLCDLCCSISTSGISDFNSIRIGICTINVKKTLAFVCMVLTWPSEEDIPKATVVGQAIYQHTTYVRITSKMFIQ